MPLQKMTTYEEIPGASQRGKPVLVDSRGYSYTLWRTNGDRRTWRCKKHSKTLACPATVIQKGEHYTEGRKDHIHVSEPGIATKLIIETEVKAMASKDMFTSSAPRIVEEMVREHADADMPSTSRPKPTNLVRAVNRKRQQPRPKDPVDIDFVLDHHYLEDNAPGFFLRDLDVRHTNNRHLIFMTDRQHQLMRDAKTWYMDGTFHVVNKPFEQLFTIHAFIRSDGHMKQIPLVFMTGRRAEDYYQVLRSIHHFLGDDIKLQRVVVDFEAGLWRAVRERFPDVTLQGCAFHWTQAVYRKVQKLGLQTAFYQKGDVHEFLRHVMCLHLLPPEHIPSAFESLRRQASDRLQCLMDYIKKTWITSRIFPVECWSTYQVSVRTNNDVEGWHNRLNSKCNRRGPVPFYLLLEALLKEARDIPLQLKMVSEGKLQRYQRSNHRSAQKKLFELWSKYEEGEISTSKFLKRASNLLD